MSELRMCAARMTDGQGGQGHSHVCRERYDHDQPEHRCVCGRVWERLKGTRR